MTLPTPWRPPAVCPCCACRKLYLVDLAGSENIKRSGAEGARQKEAGEINKSLCHLKTVIEQVFNGRKAVTYRWAELPGRVLQGCSSPPQEHVLWPLADSLSLFLIVLTGAS